MNEIIIGFAFGLGIIAFTEAYIRLTNRRGTHK